MHLKFDDMVTIQGYFSDGSEPIGRYKGVDTRLRASVQTIGHKVVSVPFTCLYLHGSGMVKVGSTVDNGSNTVNDGKVSIVSMAGFGI